MLVISTAPAAYSTGTTPRKTTAPAPIGTNSANHPRGFPPRAVRESNGTSSRIASTFVTTSDIRQPPLRREQPRWPPRQEHHHQSQNDHFRPYRRKKRFQKFIGHPQTKPRPNRPRQLPHAARHHHQKRINNV